MPQGPHPSLRFQHGEVKDFLTALQVNLDQERYEYKTLLELCRSNPGKDDAKDIREARELISKHEQIAARAAEIYTEIVVAAHKLAAQRIREDGTDRYLCELADALEKNSYDQLAI